MAYKITVEVVNQYYVAPVEVINTSEDYHTTIEVTLPSEDGPITFSSANSEYRTELVSMLRGYTGSAATQNKYTTTIGDDVSTEFNIDHNLGTKFVSVSVFRADNGEEVIVDVIRETINRVILEFADAPASDSFNVVVLG